MALLTFEDGTVRLGNTVLPGIMTDLSISGSFRSDKKVHDQLSGTVRTPLGWNDANIRVEMSLTTDSTGKSCYEKLEIIDRAFKATDAAGNPLIYQIVNRHILARGVHRVSFEKLKSAESDQTDTVHVTMDFREFISPIVQYEENALGTDIGSALYSPDGSAIEPELDATILAE